MSALDDLALKLNAYIRYRRNQRNAPKQLNNQLSDGLTLYELNDQSLDNPNSNGANDENFLF